MLRLCVATGIVCAAVLGTQDPKQAKAGPEHEFVRQFTGEWDCEIEAFHEPGKPPEKSKGTMKGHMIGNFWAVIVVHGDDAATPFHGQATFGFDAQNKKRYIGTWTDSMSDFLWQYDGAVDGNKLVLQSQGPSPIDPTKRIKAQDTWEFKGKDLIVLTGEMEGPDGKLIMAMRAVCKRTK